MKHLSSLLLVIGLLALPSCEKVKNLQQTLTKKSPAKTGGVSTDQVTTLNSANYAAFIAQKHRLIIVDYFADWCGPCQLLGPVLEKAAAAHPGVVYVGKVDVDRSKDLATAAQISSIPDVRIFKDGKQIDQIIGYPGEAKVLKLIATHAAEVIPPLPPAAAPAAPAPAKPIEAMQKDWMPQGMQKR